MSEKALKVTTKELQPRSRRGKRVGMHRRGRDDPFGGLYLPQENTMSRALSTAPRRPIFYACNANSH